MSAPETPSTDYLPDHLVAVGHYASADQGSEHGLVVLALGHPYWLMPAPDGFRLYVERSAAEDVRRQLAAFDRESGRWPPPPIDDLWPGGRIDVITPLTWSVLVLMLYHADSQFIHRWALDAEAVFTRGEVWRAFTALFFHADAEHVISNALSGILVFSAVLSTLGRLRGWVLIALAAVIGNLGSALLHFSSEYRSIGASTAIFAGIGLLSGRAIRTVTRSTHPHRWRAIFVPLAAGLTVLGLYGAGGVRVDIGAHLTGFGAGLIVGFALALPNSAAEKRGGP